MANDIPENMKEFMKMFDPANIGKMFNPQAMMENFGIEPGNLAAGETIKKVQKNFDALAKANEAAAASYRDLMEKQMQIFRNVTSQAAEQLKAGPPEDASAAYQQSVKRALEIMTELSEASQKANQQAYDSVRAQVDAAIKDLKA